MKMKLRSFSLLLTGVFLILLSLSTAQAAPTLVSPSPNSFGEVERITLNDPADVYSGGVIVVGGVEMILPKNLLIDLPANRLSLQQIFDQAPTACKTLGESGLAKADKCNGTGTGGIASLSAVRTNAGNVIVGDLFIQKANESVNGVVTYINYDQGYYRVNGLPNDPTTGAMVRLNDPGSRHTIQSGAGCAGGPNCSPDPRFGLDPDNYTNTFTTGYPVCIPSTVSRPFPGLPGVPAGTAQAAADGTGDLLCPDTNRSAQLVEPPVADSRRFAPVKVGDNVLAEGNYETVGGVRFLSAHTSTVQKALSTQNVAGQPDYLFLEEVGVEAPPYQNQRLITLIIGFTTLANPATDVDVWSVHRDPVNNQIHEFPFASVLGCDNAAGAGTCSNQGLVGAGANIFKIRHDVDFLTGPDPKLSPCAHLLASRFATSHPGVCSGFATTARDIAVLSPVPHEIIARTGKKITSPAGSLITIDINGNPATNGEYLFPLGLNLGGLGVAEMSEVNINELFTPIPFEGIPWNLDRRLGPSGCLNAAGCEAGAVGSAAFALDPFPYSGLEPRLQASLLPNVSYTDPIFNSGGTTLTSSRNRMFSYVQANGAFDGNNTLIPYALGSFPADPPLIPINPTPALSVFPPVAVADSATTGVGAAVTIDVLLNDVPMVGTIDPSSVAISSGPVSGSVLVNPNGTITYTPTPTFTVSPVTFNYTVANNFGSVSAPGTVTVIIVVPPVSVNDSFSVPAKTSATLNLAANDLVGTTPFNLAGLSIVSPPTCGSIVNNLDGDVLFIAPDNVPAAPGTCSFSYQLSDTSVPPLPTNVATVTVTITPSVVPTAVNDTASVTTGSTVIIPVLVNDTITFPATINPKSLAATPPTGAVPPNLNSGSAAPNASGTVSYTAPSTPGTYTFTYTVQNSAVAPATPATSNPATVTVTVTQGHITPVANNDTASTTTGNATTINVIANDTATAPSSINPASLAVTTPTGGTAAANLDGTITYTAPATAGTYTFTYTVKDNFTTPATSNVATVTVTVTASAPATGATLTATPASPQTVGIPQVVFNATGIGGTGTYQFKFQQKIAGVWTTVQDYSTSASFTWNSSAQPAGTYSFQVLVRNAGSTAAFEAGKAIAYTLNPAPATGATLIATPASPQAVGVPQVVFNATGIGGTGTYQFKFQQKIAGLWTTVQDYGTSSSFTWNSSAQPAGTYSFQVLVRNAGSTAVYESGSALAYTINP